MATISIYRKHILIWFRKNSRCLPWRESFPRDPYRVWISEIMLQQTRVLVVIDYFNRWIERFPNLESLSSANEEEVLSYWTGLGYYSRVKNILRTAQILVQYYSGNFPCNREDLLKLPGIGEYTVGAILSFGFKKAEPILDGNLKRFFSRFYGINFLPSSKSQQKIYWKYAKDWISLGKADILNESLMELGALVCLPLAPKCLNCPLMEYCYAYQNKKQLLLPPKKVKKKTKLVSLYILILSINHKFFITQSGKFLKGQFQFPQVEEFLEPSMSFTYQNIPMKIGAKLGEFTHHITHHKISVQVYTTKIYKTSILNNLNGKWLSLRDLKDKITHSFGQKILKIINLKN